MATPRPAADETVFPAVRPAPPLGSVFRFAGFPHSARSPRPLDPLADYGIAYFYQLLSQYQTFPVADAEPAACLHFNPQAEAALSDLTARAESAVLTWADVDRLETALLRVLPETVLRSQAWSLRARYCEVSGPAMAALYQKSKPAAWDDATAPTEELRADMEVLLSELQKYRTFLPARDRVRDKISRTAAGWSLGIALTAALAFVVTQFLPIPHAAAPVVTLIMVMMSGTVGGFVSMQSRLQAASSQSLPLLDRIELETEQFSLYLSPVSGAIFAAVLYFLFLGNFLQGSLFPVVDENALTTPANFGGLMVWSFIAGFAERLVPDVLSRLVTRSGATGDKAPPPK